MRPFLVTQITTCLYIEISRARIAGVNGGYQAMKLRDDERLITLSSRNQTVVEPSPLEYL